MKILVGVLLLTAALVHQGVGAEFTAAQTVAPERREVPVREVPVPVTVSPELQLLLARPISDTWDSPPSTLEEWRAMKAAAEAPWRFRNPFSTNSG